MKLELTKKHHKWRNSMTGKKVVCNEAVKRISFCRRLNQPVRENLGYLPYPHIAYLKPERIVDK